MNKLQSNLQQFLSNSPLPPALALVLIGAFEVFFTVCRKLFAKTPSFDASVAKLAADSKLDDQRNDKVAIVTGGNAGIGFHTCVGLARAGYTVIICSRSTEKGNIALKKIKELSGSEKLILGKLDLSNFESIKAFFEWFQSLNLPLHLLVNNAGLMDIPLQVDNKGFEMQFSTNHLGHFYLTMLLLDKLKSSAPARIVNLSSIAHFGAKKIEYDQIKGDKSKYSRLGNYAISKLANIFFTKSLADKLKDTGVIVNAVHPGAVATELYQYNPVASFGMSMIVSKLGVMKTPAEGALTSLRVSLDPSLKKVTGKYFSDESEWKPSVYTSNIEEAEKLWNFSVDVTKLKNI